jgi:D-alanine-D-alanine ligase
MPLVMLHGRPGEDGTIQGAGDARDSLFPFRRAGVIAGDAKDLAKTVMATAGVPVPEGLTLTRAEVAKGHAMAPPYVIKPVADGSSVGFYRHRGPCSSAAGAVPGRLAHGDQLLVEKYVAGKELTCAVINGEPTGVIEIVPLIKFYDYEAKYSPGASKHILPAPILPFVYQEVRRLTLAAHVALGCRGVSRADFRYDDRIEGIGGLSCLEVNTQPGMTETSLVPELAAHAGVTFDELVQWMVEDASLGR